VASQFLLPVIGCPVGFQPSPQPCRQLKNPAATEPGSFEELIEVHLRKALLGQSGWKFLAEEAGLGGFDFSYSVEDQLVDDVAERIDFQQPQHLPAGGSSKRASAQGAQNRAFCVENFFVAGVLGFCGHIN